MQACGLCVHHTHMCVSAHVSELCPGGRAAVPTFHVPRPAHECGELSSTIQLTLAFEVSP